MRNDSVIAKEANQGGRGGNVQPINDRDFEKNELFRVVLASTYSIIQEARSSAKTTQYRELKGLLPHILAADYDMGKRKGVHPQNHGLGAFLDKIQLAVDRSSYRTCNGSTTADVCEDTFHDEWPPFGPRDLMEFMSDSESVGTQLFS